MLEIEPGHLGAAQNLGVVLYEQGQTREALQHWRDVLRRQPDQIAVLNRCGWILATDPDASVRNASEAVAFAERAFHQSQGRDPAVLDTLAAAYAEAGRFSEAVRVGQLAQEQAAAAGNAALLEALKTRIELYRAGSPFREPRRKSADASLRDAGKQTP